MVNPIPSLEDLSLKIRRRLIHLEFRNRGGHLSSNLSLVEILVALYGNILQIKPQNPTNPDRDHLILSKGHAAKLLYLILAEKGFFPKDSLKTYGQDGSLFGVHPDHQTVPGVEVSTGSLGHGLSIGAGMALAAKLNNTSQRTFVVLSDGECDEGSVWETALFAGHQKLNQLTAIIDYNKFQAFGKICEVANLEPFSLKWKSFNWNVIEVDGHSLPQLINVLRPTPKSSDKPTAIIAHTVYGKGLSFTENKLEWHYLNLDKKLYIQALKELKI